MSRYPAERAPSARLEGVKPCVGTWAYAAARMADSVGVKGLGGGGWVVEWYGRERVRGDVVVAVRRWEARVVVALVLRQRRGAAVGSRGCERRRSRAATEADRFGGMLRIAPWVVVVLRGRVGG